MQCGFHDGFLCEYRATLYYELIAAYCEAAIAIIPDPTQQQIDMNQGNYAFRCENSGVGVMLDVCSPHAAGNMHCGTVQRKQFEQLCRYITPGYKRMNRSSEVALAKWAASGL
jgi:hypothetical protein